MIVGEGWITPHLSHGGEERRKPGTKGLDRGKKHMTWRQLTACPVYSPVYKRNGLDFILP
jgi:hypothetical protein